MKTDLLVVLGLDSEKKPHAARFDLADEETVYKVAKASGFKIGYAFSQDAALIAKKLVEGRLFDSGRGLVPFCTPQIYEELLKVLKVDDPPESGAVKAAPQAQSIAKDPFAAVTVGSVILCLDPQPGPDRSWWPCVIQSIQGKQIVVRWKSYPTLKPFKIARNAFGLLPPSSR